MADLLERKKRSFVLWRISDANPPPVLVIGQFQAGNPPQLANVAHIPLVQDATFGELWEVPASACGLMDGSVYHYWFEINDSTPDRAPRIRLLITDPASYSVDWRLRPAPLPAPYTDDDRYPASIVKFANGELRAADPGGEVGDWTGEPAPATLPANNRIVIYELPTAWSAIGSSGGKEIGVGTFQDVRALIDKAVAGANFAGLSVLAAGRSYLTELGINVLELLPPADSYFKRDWGYDTTNYLAPDFELGFPDGDSWPTPNNALIALVNVCHQNGIRFFIDVVMAFARQNPYLAANPSEFFILDPGSNLSDPDAMTSARADGSTAPRNGFGSTLFRYANTPLGYDPMSGAQSAVSPARQLMKAFISRWFADFHIDGIRMDSVENVYNWDFVQEFKNLARDLWSNRFGVGVAGGDERFLVVGEELTEPLALLTQGRLDGLWHINFRSYIRSAILGQNAGGETFESTVRKAIDCRYFGYSDLSQAVIYLTSHDVEGFRAERIYNFMVNNGIVDGERRIKLAFACLLTAVGMPMILAGDEFADQHDRFDQNGNVTQDGGKQVDPVDYSRINDDWRLRIFQYVARLISLRTTYDALAVNDTAFIHVDFDDNKRVLAWMRGQPGNSNCVVVVANFSDFGTADPTNPSAEYVVPNWPATLPGKGWREVSQDRAVPPEWIGREPIYPWEAKVYATF